MRLTVMGLGIIVAVAMLSHGWREFGSASVEVQAASAVLILAGVIMVVGALLVIWNPPGTFILLGLAGLLSLVAAVNGLLSAAAYGIVALLLCAMAVLDGRHGRPRIS